MSSSPAARDVARELLGARVDQPARVREHGPGSQLLEPVDLGVDQVRDARADAGAGLLHAGELLGDIRHDALRGIRRSGCAQVGDLVEQRPVGLVADGAHDGRLAGGGGAHEALVAEDEQVLEVAAAAGDDDDVDLGVGIQRAQGAAVTSPTALSPCTAA